MTWRIRWEEISIPTLKPKRKLSNGDKIEMKLTSFDLADETGDENKAVKFQQEENQEDEKEKEILISSKEKKERNRKDSKLKDMLKRMKDSKSKMKNGAINERYTGSRNKVKVLPRINFQIKNLIEI